MMQTLITIPARIGSTRFPAKPLHQIAGQSMLSRVLHIAKQAANANTNAKSTIIVATDDEHIKTHAENLGVQVVMTDSEIPSGTDRALAAAKHMGQAYDFIINLQGDAPFTPPEHLAAVIEQAQTSTADVITPVIQLTWDALDELRKRKADTPFSGTTCVRDENGRALWFSKQILPAIRKEEQLRQASLLSPVFRHPGLYGYTMEALERYTQLPQSTYEKLEGLEQLRFLENGMTIDTVSVPTPKLSMSGIDAPADAAYAEQLIATHGDPVKTGNYLA